MLATVGELDQCRLTHTLAEGPVTAVRRQTRSQYSKSQTDSKLMCRLIRDIMRIKQEICRVTRSGTRSGRRALCWSQDTKVKKERATGELGKSPQERAQCKGPEEPKQPVKQKAGQCGLSLAEGEVRGEDPWQM